MNSEDNLTISDEDLRQIKATYFGMMSEVDAQIGRLINHLKELGCYDDTLIIFTSDLVNILEITGCLRNIVISIKHSTSR
ncbi:sulfatase-like hydrolase/transferase [Roseovarius sp. M141]|uniref:sulfatase-like hydrolase/transferase n=1 Tax=Roseovarius sp. M141 TaxID=2583806 RepID=UPI0020CDA7AD|nr:hypothetical protein [Roseovarius sp. M141]